MPYIKDDIMKTLNRLCALICSAALSASMLALPVFAGEADWNGTASSSYYAEEASRDETASVESYDEASESFLASVDSASDTYAASSLPDGYVLTASGELVEVSGTAFAEALASGDQDRYLAILNAQKRSFYWDGSVLTALAGVNYGPSGKETWYNLDMSTCISVMQDYGVSGEYWVREDGCQMYGIYILCAADYSEHEMGEILETSLGTAIVADTGSFSGLIDIATTWTL